MKKLAICIPTYSNSISLKCCLESINKQLYGIENNVEVIIADNASTDNTKELCASFNLNCRMNYIRNNENIGGNRNILRIPDYATAEYCWIIGDDDYLIPGAIKTVLKLLDERSELDFIYCNSEHINLEKYKPGVDFQSSMDMKNMYSVLPKRNLNNIIVNQWQDLINPAISDVFLGSVQLAIFRRNIWMAYSKNIQILGEPFLSLNNTYPHIVVFAHTMLNHEAFYFQEPLIVVGDGARNWAGFVPMIYLTRLHDVLDLYLSMGVDEKIIIKARKYLLSMSGPCIVRLIMNKELPRGDFSIMRFITKYAFFPSFWMSFIILPTKAFIKRLFNTNE